MANENLNGKRVAILVTDGFEQAELLQPREALESYLRDRNIPEVKRTRLMDAADHLMQEELDRENRR